MNCFSSYSKHRLGEDELKGDHLLPKKKWSKNLSY